MSHHENQQRHQANKAIHKGRHGGEHWNENGHPRGVSRHHVEMQPVEAYEVYLLSDEEVLFNENLLDEKPLPDERIQSTRQVGRTEVTLYKYEIPIRRAVVDQGQAEMTERLWLDSIEHGTTAQDDVTF